MQELTPDQLRQRWLDVRVQFPNQGKDHPTCIRIHRSLSWLDQMGTQTDLDLRLIGLWIAFNALYGQWDPRLREPAPDGQSYRRFVDRALKLDRDGRLAAVLLEQRSNLMAIFENQWISGFF